MRPIETIPPRPLTTDEAETIGGAPCAGLPFFDRVYAMYVLLDDGYLGLVFDDDRRQWFEVARVDDDGNALEVERAVREWLRERYPDWYHEVEV